MLPQSLRNSRLYKIAQHLLCSHDSIYSLEYYARDVEKSAVANAPIMAKSIIERFRPAAIIDVGCGTGALLAEFQKFGCRVQGLEYSEAGLAYCRKRDLSVRKFDISKDSIDGRYDLAVSFEVAEHLPGWVSDRFIDLLCTLSSTVIISAATPGQGGTDHVNERPHSYWIDKFANKNYAFQDSDSVQLASEWRGAGVVGFYANNVMIFRELGCG